MSDQCQFCGQTSGDGFSGPHSDGTCPVQENVKQAEVDLLKAKAEWLRAKAKTA